MRDYNYYFFIILLFISLIIKPNLKKYRNHYIRLYGIDLDDGSKVNINYFSQKNIQNSFLQFNHLFNHFIILGYTELMLMMVQK